MISNSLKVVPLTLGHLHQIKKYQVNVWETCLKNDTKFQFFQQLFNKNTKVYQQQQKLSYFE